MSVPEFESESANAKQQKYFFTLNLMQRPGFCCCCLVLGAMDAKRLKRVARLVRTLKRHLRKR